MITVTNNGVQQINAALLALDREIRNVNNGIAKIQKLVDGIDLGVVSVNDKTGKVELTAEDVGALPSDTHIPTDPVQSNWTETDTSSLAYIENKPNLATVATSGSYSDLSNKPTIPAAQVNADWNATSGVACILNKPSLATVATSGSYSDLSNKPTIPAAQVNADWNATSGVAKILNKPTIPAAQVNSDWNATSGVACILNRPSLATVATSGSYNDLSNKPSIPTAQVNADWNAEEGVAEILNKPTIPTIPGDATQSASGLMSAADKTKLDGIADGATKTTKTSQLTNDSGYATEEWVKSNFPQGIVCNSYTEVLNTIKLGENVSFISLSGAINQMQFNVLSRDEIGIYFWYFEVSTGQPQSAYLSAMVEAIYPIIIFKKS